MKLRMFQEVRITHDIPEQGVLEGQTGVLVESHSLPGRPTAYSIEVLDKAGETCFVATVPEDALTPIPQEENLDPHSTARSLGIPRAIAVTEMEKAKRLRPP